MQDTGGRKFHLAKLLWRIIFEMVIRDIRRFPLGFGLDRKINFERRGSITEVLKEVGITKEYVVIWGSGEPYREFLYVDDLIEAIVF